MSRVAVRRRRPWQSRPGRPPDASGNRELLAELLQARSAVRRYAVSVDQGIAALHCGPGALVWLQPTAVGCDRAVERLDELPALLHQRQA